MSFVDNLRKGRSHLIIAATLLIGGYYVVRIEDETLTREAGKRIPQHDVASPFIEQLPFPTGTPTNPELLQAATAAQARDAHAPANASVSPASAALDAAPAQVISVTGPGAQLGAYHTEAAAEKVWTTLVGTYRALNQYEHRVVRAQTSLGAIYRLQAITGDRPAAQALCRSLHTSGLDCFAMAPLSRVS